MLPLLRPVSAVLSLLLVACGAGGAGLPAGPSALEADSPPVRLDLDVVSDGVVRVGTRFHVEAYAVDAAGRRTRVGPVWRSLTPEVVAVDEAGAVRALAVGDALVEAAYRHPGLVAPLVGEAGVRVAPVEVRAVALALLGWAAPLEVGATVRLRAEVRFSDGVVQPVEADWSVSNQVVADVDGGGVVRGLSAGRFDLRAVAYGVSGALVGLEVVAAEIPAGNAAPRVRVDCGLCVSDPRGQLRLRAAGVDPDGDPLSFSWTAQAGVLSATQGAEVVWTAPPYEGSIAVSVTAVDSHGAAAAASATLSSRHTDRTDPGAGHPPVTAFAGCPALHAAGWDDGVSRDGGTYRAAWDAAEAATYRWNTRLDFDGDGYACGLELPRVILAVSVSTIEEDCDVPVCVDSSTVTATLTRAVAGTVRVAVDSSVELLSSESDGDAVFSQDGSVLTFQPGALESSGTVRIVSVDNNFHRPAFRVVTVSAEVLDGDVQVSVPVHVTIRDDEPVPELLLSINPPTLLEDSVAGGSAEVNVQLTGRCAEPLALAVAVAPGRRTSDADFAVDGRRLTIVERRIVPSGLVRVRAVPDGSNDDDPDARDEELVVSVERLSGCPVVLPEPRVVPLIVN